MNKIYQNIKYVQQRIANACYKSGRNPMDIKLLVASKSVSSDQILIALKSGITLIGENKVQEIKEKFDKIKSISHQTHFIGHLQTNKINEVLKYVQCIQTVDRIDLIEKLQKRLELEDKVVDIFIQINTSQEITKFGINPENAVEFSRKIKKFNRLNLKGLMTIGIFSHKPEEVRKCFRLLKSLQTQILKHNIPVHELSMGMSNDLEVAIEEGSTMIRVGTAIFGNRLYPDSYYWKES